MDTVPDHFDWIEEIKPRDATGDLVTKDISTGSATSTNARSAFLSRAGERTMPIGAHLSQRQFTPATYRSTRLKHVIGVHAAPDALFGRACMKYNDR